MQKWDSRALRGFFAVSGIQNRDQADPRPSQTDSAEGQSELPGKEAGGSDRWRRVLRVDVDVWFSMYVCDV